METTTMQATGKHSNTGTQREAQASNRISFASMVRGELMKITWLRSTWIMLAILISGTAALPLFNISFPTVREMLLHDPVQYAYQYTLSQNLLIFRFLSGFFALLVTAFTIGLEYQQGTIRVILGRGAGRLRFLFSKIVALFTMALLVQVGGIFLNGALLAAVVAACTGNLSALGVILAHCSGAFLQYFLYMVFNMWVSILLATAVTMLGRSLAFGLSISLLWFPVDNVGNTFSLHLLPNDLGLKIGNFLLGPALNVIPTAAISRQISTQPFAPFVSIGGTPTIAVILVYALVFLGAAILLIRSRDIR